MKKYIRYRRQINGISLSFNSETKLTKRQQDQRFRELLNEREKQQFHPESCTFEEAAKKHLDSMTGVLSPSTLRQYSHYAQNIKEEFPSFSSKRVQSITDIDVQTVVSQYGRTKNRRCRNKIESRSPKSVRNFFGYISAVIRFIIPQRELRVILPDLNRTEAFIPSDSQVKAVVEYLDNSKGLHHYKIPILLAAFGLRRSEICALTVSDVIGDTVQINKAKVENAAGQWVVKNSTKTAASTRRVQIPMELADEIRALGEGNVYSGHPCRLTFTLHHIQDELGLPRFPVHRLRHYYASTSIALGIPLLYLEKSGGWSAGSSALRRVYAHTMEDKRREFDSVTVNHIAELVKAQ